MAQAAYCSQCGTNVYVTEDGRCPQGHGPESLSNYYEVGDGGQGEEQAQAQDFSQPDYTQPDYTQPAYTPAQEPAYSPAQQAYAGAGAQPVAPKKNKTLMIVGIVLAVLLLCGVGTGVAMCSFFSAAEDAINEAVESTDGVIVTPDPGTDAGTSDSAPATSPGTQGPDTTPPLESGVARVVLGWDGPADMELEIWTGDGQDYITKAASEYDDITDGTEGREYFDFKGDYATGTYVVSAYFLSENGGPDNAVATVTVYKTDGTTETRTGDVYWDPGSDQWHVFAIDAATGDIVEEWDMLIETE